jgi:hypothetical protein
MKGQDVSIIIFIFLALTIFGIYFFYKLIQFFVKAINLYKEMIARQDRIIGILENFHKDEPLSIDSRKIMPSPDIKDDTEWKDRILCPDDSCIGVIGPDGRCKECGKKLDA